MVYLGVSVATVSQAKTFDILKPAKTYGDGGQLFYGGNLGLQFGYSTLIDVSPMGGIYIWDDFAVGLGGTYQYFWQKLGTSNYSTHILGGRVFARYYIDVFFAHAEFELLNYEAALVDPYGFITDTERTTQPSYLIGPGYRQMMGENSFATLSILWNIRETQYTLYKNPIFRAGVIIEI